MTFNKFRLLGKKVLIEPILRDKISPGGIEMPESWQDKTDVGFVRKIGSEVKEPIKIGDRVFHQRMGNPNVELDGKIYKLVLESDVWCVLP